MSKPIYLIFCGAGLGMLIWQSISLWRGLACKGWPKVWGRVLSSEVVKDISLSQESGRTTQTTLYRAEISYSFVVHGAEYISDRVSFYDYESSSSAQAWRFVKKYPAEKQALVYYDIDNPQLSVLEPGINLLVFAFMGLGLMFALVGVLGLLGLLN